MSFMRQWTQKYFCVPFFWFYCSVVVVVVFLEEYLFLKACREKQGKNYKDLFISASWQQSQSMVNLHLYTRSQWVMPLVDEMNASLQREKGKGMHNIPKSIYLRQIKLTDLCSASQNLLEKTYSLIPVWLWDGYTGVKIPNLCKDWASFS